MSTELAKKLPDHIAKLAGGDFKKDFGNLSPRDIRAPFIKLVHGMSNEAKNGWGPKGDEPPMALGTIFVTHTHAVLEPGTAFIPLVRDTCYIEWKDGKPGTTMLHFTRNENDPKIKAVNGLEFRKCPNTGANLPPIFDTYVNFYVLTEQTIDQPVILSFYRTALKQARQFTNHLFQATQGGELPFFINRFKLGKKESKPDGQGRTWPQFTITADGFTHEKLIPVCEKMRKQAQFLATAADSAEFVTELASAQQDGRETNDPAPASPSGPPAAVPNQPEAAVPNQPAAPAAPATEAAPAPTPEPTPATAEAVQTVETPQQPAESKESLW